MIMLHDYVVERRLTDLIHAGLHNILLKVLVHLRHCHEVIDRAMRLLSTLCIEKSGSWHNFDFKVCIVYRRKSIRKER